MRKKRRMAMYSDVIALKRPERADVSDSAADARPLDPMI